VGVAGSANTTGTAGSAVGTGVNRANPAAGTRFGAGVSAGTNSATINQNPFFADPGVRQQLNLNDNQFNTLNRAYQNAYGRYQQRLSALDAANSRSPNSSAATAGGANTAANPITSGRTAVGATNAQGANSAALNEQQRLQQMQQLEQQFNQDFGRAVDTTLTDRQLRARYDQLNTQFQGLNAFNNPQVARQLQLTGAQRNQLRRLAGEWRRSMMGWRRDLGDDVNAAAAQQQWAQLRSQYLDQLNAILTPQQQQMWRQTVGQQYDFPYSMYFPSTGRGTAVSGAPARDPSTGATVANQQDQVNAGINNNDGNVNTGATTSDGENVVEQPNASNGSSGLPDGGTFRNDSSSGAASGTASGSSGTTTR
jgi:hypothetical protein